MKFLWTSLCTIAFASVLVLGQTNTRDQIRNAQNAAQSNTRRPADVNSTPAPTIVDDDSFEKELCKAKEAGEWFRLQAGDGDNCRDVIQCTSSVNNSFHFFKSHSLHKSFILRLYSFKRVCKLSVVQLVLLSTLRSKLATGRNKSRTA